MIKGRRMLNFKNFALNEMFDRSYPITVVMIKDRRYVYEFKTENNSIGIITFHVHPQFDKGTDTVFPTTWVVNFKINETTKITGEGDAFRIMATVIDAMKDFYTIRKDFIKTFWFVAMREGRRDQIRSREKLYNSIAIRFAKQYNFKVKKEEVKPDSKSWTVFSITFKG